MLILTPVVLVVSIFAVGGGHGTRMPLLICYPILFCFSVFESGDGPLLWLVLLLQFPLYGLLIDAGKGFKRRLTIAAVLLAMHISLFVLAQGRFEN